MSASLMPSRGRQLRSNDRRALTIGAIVLVAAFGYARVVRPGLDNLARQRETLVEQKALLARERSLLAVAPSLPQLERTVKRTLDAERTRLFTGDSIGATSDLSAFVTDIASATEVRLTTVDSRSPRSTRGVAQLAVDIRGEGTWPQVIAFLRVLESSARLVDLTSVRIERGARGGPLGGDLVVLSATVAGYGMGTP